MLGSENFDFCNIFVTLMSHIQAFPTEVWIMAEEQNKKCILLYCIWAWLFSLLKKGLTYNSLEMFSQYLIIQKGKINWILICLNMNTWNKNKQSKQEKTLSSQSSHLFFKLLFTSISLYLFGKNHYLHPILDQGNNTKLLHQLFIIRVYLWSKKKPVGTSCWWSFSKAMNDDGNTW